MNTERKKRVIIHINNLPPDVLEALLRQYPQGYQDHIFKVTKPNNDFFYAVTLDTDDASYLVKVDVKIDNVNDEKLDEQLFSNHDELKSDIKVDEEEAEDEPKKDDDDDL